MNPAVKESRKTLIIHSWDSWSFAVSIEARLSELSRRWWNLPLDGWNGNKKETDPHTVYRRISLVILVDAPFRYAQVLADETGILHPV